MSFLRTSTRAGKILRLAGGKIRFGLAAVKNVGLAAIQSIQTAREEKGSFASLADFCRQVDLRKVNKRVIESLIKCGAFDSTGYSRAQLLAGLEDAMEWSQNCGAGTAEPPDAHVRGSARQRGPERRTFPSCCAGVAGAPAAHL